MLTIPTRATEFFVTPLILIFEIDSIHYFNFLEQLKEERNHYLEEKEKFCAEMTRCKRKLQEMKKENVPTLPASGLKPTWQKESPDRGGGDDFNLSKTQFRKSNSVESLHLYGGDNTSL